MQRTLHRRDDEQGTAHDLRARGPGRPILRQGPSQLRVCQVEADQLPRTCDEHHLLEATHKLVAADVRRGHE
jgi:hypothetical protein